jgi:hypothetical protein
MKNFDYFKLFFWFLIGLFVYTLFSTGLLFYIGNYNPDFNYSNGLLFMNLVIGMVTLGFSLWTIIYAIMKKRYGYVAIGILEIILAIYLYVLMVVISLMTIY